MKPEKHVAKQVPKDPINVRDPLADNVIFLFLCVLAFGSCLLMLQTVMDPFYQELRIQNDLLNATLQQIKIMEKKVPFYI